MFYSESKRWCLEQWIIQLRLFFLNILIYLCNIKVKSNYVFIVALTSLYSVQLIHIKASDLGVSRIKQIIPNRGISPYDCTKVYCSALRTYALCSYSDADSLIDSSCEIPDGCLIIRDVRNPNTRGNPNAHLCCKIKYNLIYSCWPGEFDIFIAFTNKIKKDWLFVKKNNKLLSRLQRYFQR